MLMLKKMLGIGSGGARGDCEEGQGRTGLWGDCVRCRPGGFGLLFLCWRNKGAMFRKMAEGEEGRRWNEVEVMGHDERGWNRKRKRLGRVESMLEGS